MLSMCWMPSAMQHQARGSGRRWTLSWGLGKGVFAIRWTNQGSKASRDAFQHSDLGHGLLSDLQLEPMVPPMRTKSMRALHCGSGSVTSILPVSTALTLLAWCLSCLLGNDLVVGWVCSPGLPSETQFPHW